MGIVEVDTAASPALLRKLNVAKLVEHLWQDGGQTRAELARATGLSKPTTNRLVEELVDSGYLVHEGAVEHTGRPGRPAARYQLKMANAHVAGIDVGADKTRLRIAGADDVVVARRDIHGSELVGVAPELVARRIADELEAMTADRGHRTLHQAVVATPGVVLPDGGLSNVPQLPQIEGNRFTNALNAHLPCPVLVDREVNLSLLAETLIGAAVGLQHALYIQLGVGVGAGILLNGEIYRGATGAAGEVGLMSIGNVADAPDGTFGPFEWAVGGAGLQSRAGAVLRDAITSTESANTNGPNDLLTAEHLFNLAANGEPQATEIFKSFVKVLADGLVTLIAVFNPEAIILSGGLSRSGHLFQDQLWKSISRRVPFMPDIILSELNTEAGALAALSVARKQVLQRLLVELTT